ncbi:MAG: hypothetical protein ACREN4_07620 [Candidatus Dormibacteria bacterium]
MPLEPLHPRPGSDPNRVERGARQRLGRFWLEEPHWFWAVAGLTFLAGLALFLLAVGFDRP